MIAIEKHEFRPPTVGRDRRRHGDSLPDWPRSNRGWTELPRYLPIALHNELSYLTRFPRRIFFCCLTAPGSGGQTPIADMADVYDQVAAPIRRRFECLGIEMLQNVPHHRWPAMFQTQDREEVEEFCRSQQIHCGWRPDGTLRLSSLCPAAITHPDSGRRVWFNQAHLFHDSNSWELLRLGKLRAGPAAWLRETQRRFTHRPEEYAMHCRFGDGTPIRRRELNHIRTVLWQNACMVEWQPGEVQLLDNLWMAHGRMPFRGPRKVVVALADPITHAELALSARRSDGTSSAETERKEVASANCSGGES